MDKSPSPYDSFELTHLLYESFFNTMLNDKEFIRCDKQVFGGFLVRSLRYYYEKIFSLASQETTLKEVIGSLEAILGYWLNELKRKDFPLQGAHVDRLHGQIAIFLRELSFINNEANPIPRLPENSPFTKDIEYLMACLIAKLEKLAIIPLLPRRLSPKKSGRREKLPILQVGFSEVEESPIERAFRALDLVRIENPVPPASGVEIKRIDSPL